MIAFLLACSTPEPVQRPVAQPTSVEDCAHETFDELRTLCLVQVAATEADQGRVSDACAQVPEGRWRDECWFRTGEELGANGHMTDALAACGHAGSFTPFCITHAGWRGRVNDDALSVWEAAVAADLPETYQAHALDTLRARWWFNHVYGTGALAPAPDDDPYARTAWALESVRLCDGELACARAGRVRTGPALPPPQRVGRYDQPMQVPGEKDLPHVSVYGGSTRLVGDGAAEDLDIALLEALYFRPETPGDVFVSWLDDPRPRVRYTAVRLFRILPSATPEATLTALKEDPDPIVRAHVDDALRYHTWLGKGKR